MAIRHVFNWAAWLATMRRKAFQSAAEGITATLTAWGGTKLAADLPIDVLKDAGMSWKQAVAMLVATVAFRTLFAVAKYVQENPEPEVITEERPTT